MNLSNLGLKKYINSYICVKIIRIINYYRYRIKIALYMANLVSYNYTWAKGYPCTICFLPCEYPSSFLIRTNIRFP